jgi:hypothetical protein
MKLMRLLDLVIGILEARLMSTIGSPFVSKYEFLVFDYEYLEFG